MRPTKLLNPARSYADNLFGIIAAPNRSASGTSPISKPLYLHPKWK